MQVVLVLELVRVRLFDVSVGVQLVTLHHLLLSPLLKTHHIVELQGVHVHLGRNEVCEREVISFLSCDLILK